MAKGNWIETKDAKHHKCHTCDEPAFMMLMYPGRPNTYWCWNCYRVAVN